MDVETEKHINRETSDMKEEVKLDNPLQQKKRRCNFKSPSIATKRLKGNINNERVKHSVPITEDIVQTCDDNKSDKVLTRSEKNKLQTPLTFLQENANTNAQYNLKDDSSICKREEKGNGLSLIPHNVIKSLDEAFFEEDTNEMTIFEIISDTENSNPLEAKKIMSSIPNDVKDTQLHNINNTDCNLEEIWIVTKEADKKNLTSYETAIITDVTVNRIDDKQEEKCTERGNETDSIIEIQTVINKDIVALNHIGDKKEEKCKEGKNEIDSITEIQTHILSSIEVVMPLGNTDKTTTAQIDYFTEKLIPTEEVEMEKENTCTELIIHLPEEEITKLSTKKSPTTYELNNNIERAYNNDLLICKMDIENSSDTDAYFQTSQTLNATSSPKDNENYILQNSYEEIYDKKNISLNYAAENENCQTINDYSKLKVHTTVKENEHIDDEKLTPKEFEFKAILNNVNEDHKGNEKIKNTSDYMQCENFAVNNRNIETSKASEDKEMKQKPLSKILSGIDNLDKNLKEKEKKISVLYMNALDNEKQFKIDKTEILDHGKEILSDESKAEQHKKPINIDIDENNLKGRERKLSLLYMNALDYDTQFKRDEIETLNHGKDMISADLLDDQHKSSKEVDVDTNILCTPCDEEQNLTKISTDLKEVQDSTEHKYLSKMDMKHLKVEFSEALHAEQIINNSNIPEIHDNAGDVDTNILCTPCDEEQNLTKISTDLKEVQDSTEHKYLTKMDMKHLKVEFSEALHAEQIINNSNIPETHDNAGDFKYENQNMSSLIYDKFSMKSLKGGIFQLNSENSSNKYDINEIIVNSSIIQRAFVEQQNKLLHDNEGISEPTNNNLMHTIEQKKLPEVSATERKMEELKKFQKHFQDAEMKFLVTARDCFKTETNMNSSTEESSNHSLSDASIKTDIRGESKKENTLTSLYDPEDCFDMDDDFTLTASQLSMIETDEKNQINTLTQMKNSCQQTENCSSTHFGFDSITVEVIQQLSYIRESVESIKELLHTTALKKD